MAPGAAAAPVGQGSRRRRHVTSADAARTGNADGTKRAVLDAAERLFAERGFAGASLRAIGAAAGVSPPVVQHQFGGKDALYSAVVRRAVEGYAACFAESDEPVDVQAELERLGAFARAEPAALRLLAWARLERKHALLRGCDTLRRALVRRIERGQELGLVRDDIDAPALASMLEALVFYRFADRPAGPPTDDAAYVRKAAALLERGVAPGGAGRSAREHRPSRSPRR
jgi:TetR/AcrR family transcriptional regulator